MTALRQRLIEDLQLRGLAEKTQDAYVSAALWEVAWVSIG